MKKLTYEHVKQYFKEHGCELLETSYINYHSPMKYKCTCANISKISLANFKAGKRCIKCGGTEKHSFEYVKQFFEDNDCELLENNYKNNSIKMKYKCSCDRVSEINFANFKNGQRCRLCCDEKAGGNMRHSFKYVKQYFKDNDCELLESSYENCHSKIKYRCNCGNKSIISFSSFKQGHRCNICGTKRGAKKISGKNSYMWDPNLTDEDRKSQKSRLSDIKYREWRSKVYKRDDFTCQKCSQKGRQLNGHHIESWASNKKLRLVKYNGITLCHYCHIKFHKIYGRKNNNRQHLEKFLKY